MKHLTCRNCGGTLRYDPSAMTANCPYCGTAYVLDHEDTDYYRDFFRQMNRFLSSSDDDVTRRRNADELWQQAETASFLCADGTEIGVNHLHRARLGEVDMYTSRSNIIFHFPGETASAADQFRRMVSALDYPSADYRNLADFFPRVTGGFALDDGSTLLVIAKDEDAYPLSLFGQLSPRHTAWIISRLENLCCVLEFSGIAHPDIHADTIYINPYTHQAYLYGGWWRAAMKNTFYPGCTRIARTSDSLMGLRTTAAGLLGFSGVAQVRQTPAIPAAMAEFLRSVPGDTAYEDFARWDEALMRSFGQRKFIRMDTDDAQIYGGKV